MDTNDKFVEICRAWVFILLVKNRLLEGLKKAGDKWPAPYLLTVESRGNAAAFISGD